MITEKIKEALHEANRPDRFDERINKLTPEMRDNINGMLGIKGEDVHVYIVVREFEEHVDSATIMSVHATPQLAIAALDKITDDHTIKIIEEDWEYCFAAVLNSVYTIQEWKVEEEK